MSYNSELCRNPQALANFLHLRQPGIQAVRKFENFLRFEPDQDTPKPIELRLSVPHSIGLKKSLEEVARPEDILDRMRFQEKRYAQLAAAGTLTPQWRNFGRKHTM